MAKLVGMRNGMVVQAAAGTLPAGIPTGDDAKKLLVGMAAVAGGIALGAGIAESSKHGWVEETKRESPPPLFEQLMTLAAFDVSMFMFGGMLRQGIDQYGARTLGIGAAALSGGVLLLRALKR